jgi:hypothetical protein
LCRTTCRARRCAPAVPFSSVPTQQSQRGCALNYDDSAVVSSTWGCSLALVPIRTCGRNPGDRLCRCRRTRPAGPRLLHQNRCQVAGDSQTGFSLVLNVRRLWLNSADHRTASSTGFAHGSRAVPLLNRPKWRPVRRLIQRSRPAHRIGVTGLRVPVCRRWSQKAWASLVASSPPLRKVVSCGLFLPCCRSPRLRELFW